MEVEKIIDTLHTFHESQPAAKVDSVEVYERARGMGYMLRLYWYTDNDGGHEDFYL